MHEHVSVTRDNMEDGNDEDWMTQWSEEGELFADYTGKMQAP